MIVIFMKSKFKPSEDHKMMPWVVSMTCIAFIQSFAHAQITSYPAKPVRVVVTVAPGGGVDLVARVVAQKLTELIRQPFVVENRVGASGIIGTAYVAKAPADGYTLMVGTQTNHAVIPALYAKQVTYDGVRDFSPISTVASSPLFFVVNPAVPVRTVKDFIALAKQRPGELAFGAASGGTTHMAVELFKLTAGVSMLFVPYKGEGPALTDTISGQLSFQFANVPTALPHVRSGKLRGVAVTGTHFHCAGVSDRRRIRIIRLSACNLVGPGRPIRSSTGNSRPPQC
jgi:tripartite-type tricarboxylate transporter receptor subunit TctC